MTNLLFKIILTVLSIVLMSRAYISWIKSKKDSKYGITAIMASAVLIGLLIYVELFRTTMFEFLLFLAIAMLLFVFRKRIGVFLKKLSLQKGAKIKVTAAVMLFPVGIWLALALFYRTPLGMPIGVKNYLYHKYDEEFEMAGFWAATPAGHPINEFTCWPKNGNKETDSFNVVKKTLYPSEAEAMQAIITTELSSEKIMKIIFQKLCPNILMNLKCMLILILAD